MILHHSIYGWFDTQSEQICAEMIMKYPDGSVFVEIGAFMGKSTCYIAQEIKRKNKQIQFDVIDHFQGSSEHKTMLQGKDLFEIFKDNMKKAEVLNSINIISKDANEVVNNYKDHSIDFLYLDAGHSYEEVKNDIQKWLPKVRGTLVGDDYVSVHSGVIKAVNELLGKVRIHGRTWIYEVNK